MNATPRVVVGLSIALILSLAIQPTYAHGFGERYDLPVPLSIYLIGAGAAVGLSFLLIAYFLRNSKPSGSYTTVDIYHKRVGWFLKNRVIHTLVKGFALLAFILTIASGLIGDQGPIKNLAPTMVWIIFWVALTYVAALVGNVWKFINPLKTLFEIADGIYRRISHNDRLSLNCRYPTRLGVWPAFSLFLLFAWVELVYPSSATPRTLSIFILYYSFINWIGMFIFGKEKWISNGDIFTIFFDLFGSFAPTEVRVNSDKLCLFCVSDCEYNVNGCVNCYNCFNRSPEAARQVNLRPFGAGLLNGQNTSLSLFATVILILSTVTFDGFTATPLWVDIAFAMLPIFEFLGGSRLLGVETFGLLLFPLLFLTVYLIFCRAMSYFSNESVDTLKFAKLFVFSLIPIALAYHLSHYLSYLLIQGQLLITLVSDPFGYGWDLFGTATFKPNIAIVNAKFAWVVSVAAIVLGHIIAVYISHVTAVRQLKDRRSALRSQYPMLVLMIAYTMTSLWILAQPITEFNG
ncbi:MAG: hypothetical protein DK304_000125 [Chloroflexi bacterium]|nr:MAG: hypothetical protein DK304_000125 [Chloroflexota bacterium]